MTEQEQNRPLSPYAYHQFTCNEHKKHETKNQVEVVQKQLGIISEYSDKLKKCQVCESELNADETNTITENDVSITCNKHREFALWQQQNLINPFIEFRNLYPEAGSLESPEWRKKFSEWRKEKHN